MRDDVTGEHEFRVMFEKSGGEGFHKIEDAGFGGLVFTEGFVIHEKIAELPADLGSHLGEFFVGEREVGRGGIGEAERDGV